LIKLSFPQKHLQMTVKRKAESFVEATCSAPVNIAVIKYWGKRDSKLILPTNSSLSLTLNQDDLCSTTTIRAVQSQDTDKLWINGSLQENHKRFVQVLQQARKARKEMEKKDKSLQVISDWGLVIASKNNFPTAAGLASSASGFACMTFCLAELYNLDLEMSEISRIARVGSGSACRSLFGGFVKWEMGIEEDGSDSMAVQVAREDEWPGMEALVLVVSDARKDTGSTEGMQETVETSELLKHRIEHVVPRRMQEMEEAIKDQNFDKFAELTMADSNQFHAVCLDTFPPIFYMNDISRAAIKVINAYNALHVKKNEHGENVGYRACYTFDAGPNAVIYLQRKYVPEVLALVDHFFPHSSPEKEYYGRASLYRDAVKKHSDLVDQMSFDPWPVNSLKRLISTSVGDGPRLLSTSCDQRSLLHADKHCPLTTE
jgi:diphosphomevalonate decarboxylase